MLNAGVARPWRPILGLATPHKERTREKVRAEGAGRPIARLDMGGSPSLRLAEFSSTNELGSARSSGQVTDGEPARLELGRVAAGLIDQLEHGPARGFDA
jgi:hypothetical protein